MPRVLRRLPRRLARHGAAMRCDQVTVNEYAQRPARGPPVAPNVSTHSAFGPTILSLPGSATLAVGVSVEGAEDIEPLFLPRRSLPLCTRREVSMATLHSA